MDAEGNLAQRKKGNLFRNLHSNADIFVMPNAWDAGSARMLSSAGFTAIATTSAGIAFSLGLPDYAGRVSRMQMMDCIHRIATAVNTPVNADLEAGYGNAPEDVAETIRLSIQAGIVGGNIEDYTGNANVPLFDERLAVERIRAAREAADSTEIPFTVTARTDCYLAALPDAFAKAVHRSNLYREAGADCLFVPGVKDLATIAALVREIDGPLTVVMGLSGTSFNVADLKAIGVKRISIGGSLARAAFALIRGAAQEMRERGSFSFSEQQIPDGELCNFFAAFETGA
ncbi:MAG TPA: isocitrate lyase/phosphoenolpyruvate mutase family protein [Burkholderiaceae bacterium]|nr:isocitrate lyase/phosphoenolpyruvate mutase family protein [Burkholderiaceae bacterium]